MPKWAEPVEPAPAPQRSRWRTGSKEAQPQSSLETQPLEKPDACSLAPGWETPAIGDRPEDWPDQPRPDADQAPEKQLSLPMASYPEELPSLPLAGYPEEPMVLESLEDTVQTQVQDARGLLAVSVLLKISISLLPTVPCLDPNSSPRGT
ncbi:hypothetical protein UY3_18209 [Chelonia mydas]|uniref:Uncharacterized protein n=1 Tax=Chelonia mydas TaxID=8469 RepID=M7APP9_CHEMY|nr:hypothetical protein UY3_18209 [Chelonia mydas]